ncbi:MAG: ATP-binding protein [Deltaproteobacteria bacterium]|nr:ATP-binding protein [Deltaproteobacteria bacterium]
MAKPKKATGPARAGSDPTPESLESVGIVLGTRDVSPLEFWVGVRPGHQLELDDHVVVDAETPRGEPVTFYGLVDQVKKRLEGTQFDGDGFRVAEGLLPAEVSHSAHVQVTRIEPEVFAPPEPGDPVRVVRGSDYQKALCFDRMERKIPVGLTRSGEPVYANLEFLDGTRGAHASISGIPGVATKTSYATFLIYSLFRSNALGIERANTKALIFNVKGEDLLWLDKPNAKLTESARREYEKLQLPVGPFESVGLFAPVRKGPGTPMPATGGRQTGVSPYAWTLRAFARDRLLRFAFAEADDVKTQVSFVIARVEAALQRAAEEGDKIDPDDPSLTVASRRLESFRDLVDLADTPALDTMMGGSPLQGGTLDAFRRRLHAASDDLGHLIRGDHAARKLGIDWARNQVTVVDIHGLRSRAQMFVVGVLLQKMMSQKESQGTSRPLVFVVLDELNKYAPREGSSSIKEVLRDIAERGRSLGVSLLGAQQTASEVERRVVGNASIRVVGRLDVAESERSEYGYLTSAARSRASLLQPGTMIVTQPEIPTPILLRFPFPAWATRKSEAVPDPASGQEVFHGFEDPA